MILLSHNPYLTLVINHLSLMSINTEKSASMIKFILTLIGFVAVVFLPNQVNASSRLLLISELHSIAQNQELDETGQKSNHVVSGFVVDAESSESLIGATIYAPEMLVGTTTNRYGFFSITVPTDSVRLIISYVGYLPRTIDLVLTEDIQTNFELTPELTTLDDLEVTAVGESAVEAIQMSQIKLPVETIRALPVLAGETDIFKTLQLLPGVQSGREGTAGLYIRGGTPDQNLILLDGVPIYNPSHLYGFLSIFNSDAIKDVTLIKGGIPARYGGRLSSVVDITMEEGNLREFEGTASIGLIGSSFTLQGPIKKDKASFIVAARRTYLDLLVYPFLDENDKAGYYFYDASAKINYIISDQDRVYLSFYAGSDRSYTRERWNQDFDNIQNEAKGNLGWRNLSTTMRWNRVWSGKVFSNTLIGYTHYRIGTRVSDQYHQLDDRSNIFSFYRDSFLSGISDVIGRIDFDYAPNPIHYIRFGAGSTLHAYNTGTVSEQEFGVDIVPVDTVYHPGYRIRATQIHAYIEDEIRLLPQLSLNAGIRASSFFVRDRRYDSIEPRLNARWKFSDNMAFKTSYTLTKQNSHLLPVANGLSLPLDLWVPATNQVRPQSATQMASGFAWNSPKRTYEVTVEGFYKWMNSLIEYSEGARTSGISGDFWETQVETGKGWSYGGELFVRKSKGRLTGWIGYSLTKTQRKFPELNGGRVFPFRFDRLHDLSATAIWKLSPSVDLSAVWVYGTGQAVWLPVGQFYGYRHDPARTEDFFDDPHSRVVRAYGERNSVRTSAYHRLDLSVQFKRQRSWAHRILSFGVYNAYARKNAFLLQVEKAYDQVSNDELNYFIFKEVSAFPIIPFVRYRLEF